MYQKFIEDKYGIKVASLNIIPINVSYPTPLGFGNGKIVYEISEGNNYLLMVKSIWILNLLLKK